MAVHFLLLIDMEKRTVLLRTLIISLSIAASVMAFAQPKEETTDIRRVWDRGGHNAYSDITFTRLRLFIAFREAPNDIPTNESEYGKIRILSSTDGEFWESSAVLEIPGVDLRDPKITFTPKKRLMLLVKGVKYDGQSIKSMTSYMSQSDAEGKRFSKIEPLELEDPLNSEINSLQRMTWYDKTGYGIFTKKDPETGANLNYLIKNEKKKELEVITELELPGEVNDITVRFLSGAEMMIIAEMEGSKGLIGTSKSPYKDWTWEELEKPMESVNFEVIPINKVLLGTTLTDENGKYAALLQGKKGETFNESFRLPSGGDTGHMGMFAIAGFVWLSYHSSHEGKTSIYYARIPFKYLQ